MRYEGPEGDRSRCSVARKRRSLLLIQRRCSTLTLEGDDQLWPDVASNVRNHASPACLRGRGRHQHPDAARPVQTRLRPVPRALRPPRTRGRRMPRRRRRPSRPASASMTGCSQGKPRTRQRHAEERNLWASRSKTSSNKYRPPPDPADLIGHRVIAGRNSS